MRRRFFILNRTDGRGSGGAQPVLEGLDFADKGIYLLLLAGDDVVERLQRMLLERKPGFDFNHVFKLGLHSR